MSSTLRNTLLGTAGAFALFAGTGAMATPLATANGGGSTLATPLYELEITAVIGTNNAYNYCSSGSGAAQTAFLTNAIGAFGCPSPTNPAFDSSNSSSFPTNYPTTGAVDFGASDAALTAAQIATFDMTFHQQVIQVPTFGTPITLPFNINSTLNTTNGAINLTSADVCGIFSGKITNWSGIATPFTTAPITVVYRGDGSGTSFLLTQHLGATCNTTNSNFFNPGFPNASPKTSFAGSTTFASFFPAGGVPSNFVAVTGSPSIASTVLADTGSIGYVSPDLTRESPTNRGNTALPWAADVDGVEPTTANTKTALGSAPRPTNLTDQTEWVPAVPTPASGYPIVGYTTWDVATCYASAASATAITDFLNTLYNTTNSPGQGFTVVSDITNSGFVPVTGSSTTGVTTASLAGDIFNNLLTNNGGLGIQVQSGCASGVTAR